MMDPNSPAKQASQQSEYDDCVRAIAARWGGERGVFQKRERTEERVILRRDTASDQPQVAKLAESFVEETRRTPVVDRCDVLVVGGGPAGLCAALAAARAGADTLLVERYGCVGGVITTVGMETLGWYRYEGAEAGDTEGLGRELERVARQMGATTPWPCNDSDCLDTEAFKSIADGLLSASGVRVLLHTLFVDAIMDQGTILGVLVENKDGRGAILASRVVDCSGDADVAHRSGAEYTRLPLSQALGVTSVFNVSGVDVARFKEYTQGHPSTYADWDGDWKQDTTGKESALPTPYLTKPFEEAERLGLVEAAPKHVSLNGSWSALHEATGEATNLNLVHMHGYDALKAADLTAAEIEGRRQVARALKALRSQLPGFEAARLRNHAMTLGIRDSRKIVGKTNLSAEDVLCQGRFADSVGVFPEFVDGYNILVLPTTGRFFEIPLGCLVPKDVDNLLAAGRCVAGDSVSHAAVRNMMCCCVTGQAAGAAAAVSIRANVSIHHLDPSIVQSELMRQGARIH